MIKNYIHFFILNDSFPHTMLQLTSYNLKFLFLFSIFDFLYYYYPIILKYITDNLISSHLYISFCNLSISKL